MRLSRSLFGLVLILAAACAAPAVRDQARAVEFRVDATRPESGTISVRMTVSGPAGTVEHVAIPAWAPGAYRIRTFHKSISKVRAVDARGGELAVARKDDLTWSIATAGGSPFTVEYEVKVPDQRMGKEHCFIPGPGTYLYVVGDKTAPCRVRFALPEGWRVGTGLDEKDGWFSARDYDTFIDCPTELGTYELFEFREEGILYQIIVHAPGPVDGPGLVDVCRRIVREQNAMFGGAPFRRYVFLYHLHRGFGGYGLEHLNSTHISMPYNRVVENPASLASITSHEYFHVWNVKRIRPKVLGPFDYTGIVRTKTLWLMEGGTSYFGDRTLARCGIWDEERYFRHLADEIERLQRNPDRKVTSVERASEMTWDRREWPQVDYYNKGELICLLIDLKIRMQSGGMLTLDDVMRWLYRTYVTEGPEPIGVGFPEGTILKAMNTVTGTDWTDFFGRYISGLEELPYEEVLSEAGLEIDLTTEKVPDLGCRLRGTRVMYVPRDGEALRAGIKRRDRILAINGVKVTRANLSKELSRLKAGEEIALTIGRGEKELTVKLKVDVEEKVNCSIRRASSLSAAQARLLGRWLGR
jgi:predicted metalloprotease with PDZ domain